MVTRRPVTRITRRAFIRLALAASGGLLAGCAQKTPAPLPTLTPAPTLVFTATPAEQPAVPAGLNDFLKLSALLLEQDHLDPAQGRLYFEALQDRYTRGMTLSDVYAEAGGFDQGLPADLDALRQSGFFEKPGIQEVAGALASMWYSATYPTREGLREDTLSALAWAALDFTHLPTQCGGLTGYWAVAPKE